MSVETLTPVAEGVIVRPMLTLDDAIDLWLAHLTRIGRSQKTRDNYREHLDKLADRFPRSWDVAKLREDDCTRFLDLWNHRTKGTRGQVYAAVNGLFYWLCYTHRIKTDPMYFVQPPGRDRPEDLEVKSVSSDDVRTLLRSGQTWSERLAVAIPVYLGPRRHAVAMLRLSDYDRSERRRLRFREKGAKTIWKPVPGELVQMLETAIGEGAISGLAPYQPEDPYLVPPEGPLVRRERDDRVIWRLVKRVAERAGVQTHVHALRAAFAVYYLESGGGRDSLQTLLGHRSPSTTEVYLRRLDREQRMEGVRGLSWNEPSVAELMATAKAALPGAGKAESTGTPALASSRLGFSSLGSPLSDASFPVPESAAWAGNASDNVSVDIVKDRFESSAVMGAGGFEPPYEASPGPERAGTLPSDSGAVE